MLITPNKTTGGVTAFQKMNGRPFVSEGNTQAEAMSGMIDLLSSHAAKTGEAITVNRPTFDEPRMARGRV